MARRVEHHFNDTLHLAAGRLERADIHAKTARDRGAHLFGVQGLALNLAAVQHVFGEGSQDGFLPQGKAEPFHAADEAALLVTECRQGFGETVPIPMKSGQSGSS
jgi:hypothetical protein